MASSTTIQSSALGSFASRRHATEGLSLPSARQLYEQLALRYGSRSIRLLDLQAQQTPATEAQPLKGHLRVACLDDSPSFIALSYVWGAKSSPPHAIKCLPQGVNLEIPTSCFHALKRIRERFGAITIWIDSVCIDQEDSEEKAGQIVLMQDIYSVAQSVIVWLGEGNERSDQAMRYLQQRARYGRRLPLAFLAAEGEMDKKKELQRFKTVFWQDLAFRFKTVFRHSVRISGSGVDLDEVLDREWTRRSWTFQELILACNPIVLCGDKAISWEDLLSAICIDINKSGVKHHDMPLLASAPVLAHWWSMTDIWLSLPRPHRPYPYHASQIDVLAANASSFKDHIISRAKHGVGIPSSLRLFHHLVAYTCSLTVLGAWGFAIFMSFKAAKPGIDSLNNGSVWLLLVFAWFVVTLIALTYVCLVFQIPSLWFHITHGIEQKWLLRSANDVLDDSKLRYAGVIDGIRAALRERVSSNHHDKAFSLAGILKTCGASPSRPDYSSKVQETYRVLCQDLFSWQPAALIILMDAGGSTDPSWVPDFSRPCPSTWLTSRYRLGVTEDSTPITTQPTFSFRSSSSYDTSAANPSNKSAIALRGRQISKVALVANMHFGRTRSFPVTAFNEHMKSNLSILYRWYSKACSKNSGLKVFDYFAALEGISPKRGPTHKTQKESLNGGTGERGQNRYIDVQVRLPLWQGPYDFTDKKADFAMWEIICGSLDHLRNSSRLGKANEMRSRTSGPLLDEVGEQALERKLLAMINNHPERVKVFAYLDNLTRRIVDDRRCLFLLENGEIGTGPLDIKIGDEPYLLAGIPAPMVLRPNNRHSNEDDTRGGYEVIGAALVHKYMHGENFTAEGFEDVVLE
ncbi:heterokaryon incompatibility protein-domain-containing protein [Bombardia bombarda]|uniref:Heterokaryon incompatibility protein-domain-containing protein n=1 Tax=Bombardia bombarda TaxID=252184 RepID=A0AA39XBA0_9PEZI|nr:heterokaryon incompatibility protein-domain-containing protein [Bombardia bombarda]